MSKKVNKAVITAAGFGTRFLPVVKNIPKEMLPVINKPILQYVVEECISAQLEEIIIVVRKGNQIVEQYFKQAADEVKELLTSVGKADRFASVEELLSYKNIRIIEQDPSLPYGNGSPILSAKPYLNKDEPFAILFADDLVFTNSESSIKQLINTYESNEVIGVTGAQSLPLDQVSKYGVIEPGEIIDQSSGVIKSIIEKPPIDEAPSDLVTYGRFVVSYDIFDYLLFDATGKDNELWLQDANSHLANRGRYLYKVVDGHWVTTGDPLAYLEALLHYYINDEKLGADAREILARVN